MIEWTTVLGLLIFGAFMVVAEIVFIPGIFIGGLIGVISSITGVYLGYEYFTEPVGHYILVSAIVLNILSVWLVLRGRSWEIFSLKEVSKSKLSNTSIKLQVGDEGVSISSLKPIGKAEFEGEQVEVRSLGDFIVENEPIVVVRIEARKILVKKIN